VTDKSIPVPLPDPVPEGCALKNAGVAFFDMNPRILGFLAAIGPAWKTKFGTELVITSARDGNHAEGGGHYAGDAVDIRSWGLSVPERLEAAALILSYADTYLLRLYDESRLPSAAHFHVDTVA
jgi:hypothetical protein